MELRAVNGVTVTGPTRISSTHGTFCWTSGPFVTIVEGEKGLDNAEYVSVKVRAIFYLCHFSIFSSALSPAWRSPRTRKESSPARRAKTPACEVLLLLLFDLHNLHNHIVWCRESKKYTAKFSGHRFEIINVAWHPEGKHVLSCGDQHDRQIFIWCLRTGEKMATSRLQQEPSFSLFFSAKTFIAVGKGNAQSFVLDLNLSVVGLIRFWTFPAQRTRVAVQTLTGRNAPLKQRRDHTFIDACATSTNVFAVAEEGIAKLSGTRSLQSWFDYSKCQCISTNGEHLFLGVNTDYGGCVLGKLDSFNFRN